jgi:hypothetical protein
MAYKRILIDNFNGASIDFANRWVAVQGSGIPTQTAGTLNMPCVMDYPKIDGKNYFDLSKGIFAAKLSVTGTRADASEFYIGAHDESGNQISAAGSPFGAYVTFEPAGLATFNNEVKTDTTVGVGPSWVNGKWWGIGNMTSDNVVRMYNSIDGQIWNEMARCTVGGTFNKTRTAILFKTGIWNGTTTDLTARFDDASFWMRTPESSRLGKVRVNGAWTNAIPKIMVGGQWVASAPHNRVGNIWRTPQ